VRQSVIKNFTGRFAMEKMAEQIMQGFCSGISDSDWEKMKDCFEKKAVMCQCGERKTMADDDQIAVKGKMMSCCVSMMRTMSSFGKCAEPSK
jgi:hypothetical protein